MNRVYFKDLGTIAYYDALRVQEEAFDKVNAEKKSGQKERGDGTSQVLILCEHPHVYTLGKSGQASNLLVNDEFLRKIDARFYKTNRGGDITYHGPGQVVGYPVFDLESMKIRVKEYIWLLEESIISLLRDYQLDASRLDGATGVWLDKDIPGKARKICAIGVRISRYVTMHGFALNINTDLKYFQYINPCGFNDKDVTSLQKETGKEEDMVHIRDRVKDHIANVFNISWIE
jgi:lipoyl(octanoyl) transferase